MLAKSRLFSCKKAAHCQKTITAKTPAHQHPLPFKSFTRRQQRPREFSKMTFAGFFSGLFGGGNGSVPQGNHADILKQARQARPLCPPVPEAAPPGKQLATFAGGCFWGLELAYQRVPGVIKTSVGYTGGHDPTPNYNSVCSGRTGHAEAVQVIYDPQEVKYEQLLDTFFQHVDPTSKDRQGGDRGTQYRSAIYYYTPEQKAAAQKAFEQVNKQLSEGTFRKVAGKKVVTELEEAGMYYVAEQYHQQYLSRGGRFGFAQSAQKGATEKIRCYG